MRQTSPLQTPTWYFIVSGRADRFYTLLKGDLEVVVTKGNLITPRHSWRCNKKSSFNTGEGFNGNQRLHDQTESIKTDDSKNIGISKSPSTCNHIKCSCGKVCKGLRGLKMHQWTCRVIKDLADETFEFVQDDLIGSYNNDDSSEEAVV